MQTVMPGDAGLSCAELNNQYAEAQRFRDEADKEKGMTGGNVARALFFWPAILGTFSNANEAMAAADGRKVHLANLMTQKNCGVAAAPSTAPVATSSEQPSASAAKPAEQASATATTMPGGAPVAAATRASNPRLPKIGDRWEYSYRNTYGRQRVARYQVTEVYEDEILERGGFADTRPGTRSHAPGAVLVLNDYFELSPYLQDFGIPPDTNWRSLTAPTYAMCQRPSAFCRFEAKVIRGERVTTPAGSFNTLKVVIDLNLTGMAYALSGSTAREMTFWYSESAKRVVKAKVRTIAGSSNDDDYDLELVSYKLN